MELIVRPNAGITLDTMMANPEAFNGRTPTDFMRCDHWSAISLLRLFGHTREKLLGSIQLASPWQGSFWGKRRKRWSWRRHSLRAGKPPLTVSFEKTPLTFPIRSRLQLRINELLPYLHGVAPILSLSFGHSEAQNAWPLRLLCILGLGSLGQHSFQAWGMAMSHYCKMWSQNCSYCCTTELSAKITRYYILYQVHLTSKQFYTWHVTCKFHLQWLGKQGLSRFCGTHPSALICLDFTS